MRVDDRACAPAWCDPSPGHGGSVNYKKFGDEPPDHAIGSSRDGLMTKNRLVCEGGRDAPSRSSSPPGHPADTSMLAGGLPLMLEQLRAVGRGRHQTRPDRVTADKGYPSRANRA